MKHATFIGILAAAAAAACYLAYIRTPATLEHSASPAPERAGAEPAAGERRIAAQGFPPARGARPTAAAEPLPGDIDSIPSDRTARAEATGDAEQVLPPESEEPVEDRFAAFRRARLEELEGRFTTQARDTAWEIETKRAVTRESARVQGGKLHPNDIECGESLCRVTFRHEAGGAPTPESLNDMIAHMSDRFGVEIDTLADRSIVYVERKARVEAPGG